MIYILVTPTINKEVAYMKPTKSNANLEKSPSFCLTHMYTSISPWIVEQKAMLIKIASTSVEFNVLIIFYFLFR